MPANIDELKQVARIRTSKTGEAVVEIPLAVWVDVLLQIGGQSSQLEQIETLLQQWENDIQNEMPDSWWDDFQSFLRDNRLRFDDLETSNE